MKNFIPKLDPRRVRLAGKKSFLRLLVLSDVSERYLGWMNDPQVVRFMRHRSYRSTMKSLEDFVKSREWPRDLTLAIVDRETNLHIGNIGLTAIDWANGKAELGMLLGDRNFWGQGYMSEAFDLITTFAFSRLKLHRLYAGTERDNQAAVRLFKKAGWEKEGIFKDDILRNGEYVDVIRFAILNKGQRI